MSGTSCRCRVSVTHGQHAHDETAVRLAGAVCLNWARTDLCGGRPVMGVPTAISHAVCFTTILIDGAMMEHWITFIIHQAHAAKIRQGDGMIPGRLLIVPAI